MRINLTDGGKTKSRRKKGKRRRSRTFESSIALPQTPARGLGGKPQSKGTTPERQPGRRTEQRTRPGRRSRARQQQDVRPETVASPPRAERIRWGAIRARVPAVLLLAALVGGIAYVSTDAKFFVYDAQIVGARHIEHDTIYQASGVHEQNILWVQPQDAAQRIIQIEGIKAVRVSCGLPAKVVIEVEEREPVVMWRLLTQGQDLWLDEEGFVLPYHGDVNSANTLFVVDSSESPLQVGETIQPEGIVRSVQRLATTMPATKIYSYDADRGLSFVHKAGDGEWPVYVGSSDNLARKIQVVQVLTDYLTAQNIRPRYVDVRWPDHPVFGKPPSE